MSRISPILISRLAVPLALSVLVPSVHAQEAAPSSGEQPSGAVMAESQLLAGRGPSAPIPGGAGSIAPKSRNVTVNLINRMVQRGLLPKEDAEELIRQAEQDAEEARTQAVAVQVTAEQAAAAAQAALSAQGQDPSLDEEFAHKSDESVRVTYIPEVVRAQMRDEIKQEVMDQARAENWAAPRTLPDWVSRIRLFGDVRGRYEGIYYADGNDNTGVFPDFNAINTGAPFDVSGSVFSPQINGDQDRQRARLRVRAGAEADLLEGFTAGVRVATGADNSPVTTNQTLGAASGQGSNFSKYAIWLDRGFLKYEFGSEQDRRATLTLGRFDNPFFSSEVMWDEDIGFDGLGVQGRYRVGKGITPFFAAGAFPIFNTNLNYATNQPAKFESEDRWLYAAQVGTDWKIRKDLNLKVAASYYDFQDIEGRLSDPFTPLSASDAGNTDATRPAFAQKGNTYRALRNIVPNALNNYGTTNQWQYFGLATPFRVMALTGRLTYDRFEPVQISLSGEYLKNLAFNGDAINRIAVNNRGASDNGIASFAGGDTAWIVGLKFGYLALQKRWDWNVGVNYRYVESDAVVDAFTDSDFGGGGTNVKGYSIFGNVALSRNVYLGARYMSADEVAGPPLGVDIFQIDLGGKF